MTPHGRRERVGGAIGEIEPRLGMNAFAVAVDFRFELTRDFHRELTRVDDVSRRCGRHPAGNAGGRQFCRDDRRISRDVGGGSRHAIAARSIRLPVRTRTPDLDHSMQRSIDRKDAAAQSIRLCSSLRRGDVRHSAAIPPLVGATSVAPKCRIWRS
jgi:hypothetical protein